MLGTFINLFKKNTENILTFYTMHCIVICIRRYPMDVQLKKGLLDLVVLASIKYEDSYGYKIIQDMSQIIEISESTLYPILKRLEKQKLVKTYNTTHNSRIRKYYRINSDGLRKLQQSIDDFDEIKQMYMYIKR